MDPMVIGTNSSALASMGIATLLIMLVSFIVLLVAWYKIFKKAGYPGWYTILMIIPIVNLIIFLVFAFSQWPVLKESAPQPPATPQA